MAYVFSDITGADEGLIQECEDISGLGAAGISGNTARLKTFTRRLNQAKDRFFTLAFKYDALWNFDSTKQVDLPIGYTSLTSGIKEYALSLFHTEVLQLTQLFAKDPNGVYHELTPQDDKASPSAYTLTNANGTPTTFELVGNSLLVDPTPNYNQASTGLKAVFKRNDIKFVYTDGAVPIGTPSLFFGFLARQASLPYLIEKRLAQKNDIATMIQIDEKAICEFVSTRAKPKRIRLGITNHDNR